MASVGLLFIMLGIRWVLKRNWSQLTPSFEALQAAAQQLDQLRIFIAIIGVRFLSGILDSSIPYGSSLTQFVTYCLWNRRGPCLCAIPAFFLDTETSSALLWIFCV